jgi:hypothetical protein
VTSFRILRCYKLAQGSTSNSKVLVPVLCFFREVAESKSTLWVCSLNSEISPKHSGFLREFLLVSQASADVQKI